MKSKTLVGLGAAGFLFVGVLGASAKDDEVPDHNLSEFTLGEHVSGDEVDLSKQKGRVVVLEYWGTR